MHSIDSAVRKNPTIYRGSIKAATGYAMGFSQAKKAA